jgi:hypothetical protein
MTLSTLFNVNGRLLISFPLYYFRMWLTTRTYSFLIEYTRAILTLLSLDGVPDDPLARTASVLSLICALMSIIYACLYIVRFGAMRKMYKAASWAQVSALAISCIRLRRFLSRRHIEPKPRFSGIFGRYSLCLLFG